MTERRNTITIMLLLTLGTAVFYIYFVMKLSVIVITTNILAVMVATTKVTLTRAKAVKFVR